MSKQIRRLNSKILLSLFLCSVVLSHFLFLAQLDYVVYDHDQRHTARPALTAYYQLKDGRIKSFLGDMFGQHQGFPRYPAFIGYLTGAFCYLFGLSEISMRLLSFVFYSLLIFYTFLCAREVDSREAGFLSVLILATMPIMVFWSRMIFPAFLGAALFMPALYYMLKSENFCRPLYCILFGIFSGMCILTHRVMFIPLFALWTAGIAVSLGKKRAFLSLKGLALAILAALLVCGKFLTGYFQNYDVYRDLSRYSLDDLISLRWDMAFWRFAWCLGQFGYDNLALIFYPALLFIFLKRKIMLKDKGVIFEYVTVICFILFIAIWFAVTFFSEINILNVRHFQVLAPMLAVFIAIYLNRLRAGKYIVVCIKTMLMIILIIMIIPRFGASPALSVFRRYYRIPNIDGYGNGVIWSDRTFARRDELDYFREEISKGDIFILNRPVWNHLVTLCDRLRLNGIGREVSAEGAAPSAAYMIFYCVSSDSPKEYALSREQYTFIPGSEGMLRIEGMINESASDQIGPGEKLAITDTYQVFSQADILEEYISQFHFKIARIFEYHTGGVKMYKVIFKSNKNIPELINLPELNEYRCLLRKI